MDSPPSIFIEPPEDDHQEFVSSTDYTSPLFTTDFSQGDEHIFYNQSNVSTDSILSHDLSFFPSFLDTTLGGANFTSYRQPESPNSPLSDPFPDDFSDLFYQECPSPIALSDSSLTTNSNSPYPTTPLQELNSLNFQEIQSPQLPSANEASSSTVAPVDLGRSTFNNGFYDHCPPTTIAASSGHDLEPQVDDNLLAHVPTLSFPQPRAFGHRPNFSEPYIPTGSLLMEESGTETHRQPLTVQIDSPRHYRSHSDSNSNNDLLSPDSAQQSFRGRSPRKVGSRSQSRRSSPYMRPSTSQESFHDVDPYLIADLNASPQRTLNSGSASFPGTPVIGNPIMGNSEASASTQSLISSSTSIMVMNPGNQSFDDILNGVGVTPRKVGSEKLDEASNKRRKNEAKHHCSICNRTLTTKHNVKSWFRSFFFLASSLIDRGSF
ncbi:hypothetical protein JOM56_013983 [Amanita muscaria]